MDLSVSPISLNRERSPERREFQEKIQADCKITDVVLEKMRQSKGAALLSSASAPEVVMNLLPAFDKKNQPQIRGKRKKKDGGIPVAKLAPIGLQSVDPEGCVNALMQLIMSIPSFVERIYLAPRSFHVIQEFVDRYLVDQKEKLHVAQVHGGFLYQFFSSRVEEISLLEIFQLLIRSFNLDWQLHSSLTTALQGGRPKDIFVIEPSDQKQLITQPDFLCYELDAFVELRSDGSNVNFVTFVKVQGIWYQCDDERVTQLRSVHLSGPMRRSILMHYKKISLSGGYDP